MPEPLPGPPADEGLPVDRTGDWSRLRVLVTGIGVSGFAAAEALLRLGATVSVRDDRDGEVEAAKATILDILGADVRLGPAAGDATAAELAGAYDLVVTSPAWRPTAPLLAAAAQVGMPIWGEVELAWRLGDPARSTAWLAVTGTNGKTTTVRMLASILRAAGLRATAAGNVGDPLVSAVLHPRPYDALAIELSSFQLHWTRTMSAEAAAVLNVAPDHLDWHGSLAEYARAKGRIYQRARRACVYAVADAVTERLVRDAEVAEGCRAIGVTLGIPGVGMVGVVDDTLVDRAFVAARQTTAAELAAVSDVRPGGDHNVANALAAAALARAHGVPPVAVRDGLRGFAPDPHRIQPVATVRGVAYVDDSKATNTHAAAASLAAFAPVVWIAGGLAKGATFDDLVAGQRDRLRGVVLLGADRALVAQALARHAPEVPVVEVGETDTAAMSTVVARAAALARPGDTVLLAPACASMDMFAGYAARGEAFAAAVHALAQRA